MTTLADGANITLTLSDYDSVTVSTRGVVTVEAVSGLGVTAGKIEELTGTRTFGPYAVAGSLKLASLGGSVEYEVADGATPGTPALFYRDSSGNVTGLVGAPGIPLVIKSVGLLPYPGVFTVTGTTAVQSAELCNFGNLLAIGDTVLIRATFGYTGSTNGKTINFGLGASGAPGVTLGASTRTSATETSFELDYRFSVSAVDKITKQPTLFLGSQASAMGGEQAVTLLNSKLYINLTLALATETITLHGYTVTILKAR